MKGGKMKKEIVGKKLKYIREKSGLSMDKLANEINNKYNSNISKSMISSWENGRYLISPINLNLYIDYFDVPVNYLIKDNISVDDYEKIKKSNNSIYDNINRLGNKYKGIEKIKYDDNIADNIRREIGDDMFLIHENLNILGLLKILEYSEDIAKIEDYTLKYINK